MLILGQQCSFIILRLTLSIKSESTSVTHSLVSSVALPFRRSEGQEAVIGLSAPLFSPRTDTPSAPQRHIPHSPRQTDPSQHTNAVMSSTQPVALVKPVAPVNSFFQELLITLHSAGSTNTDTHICAAQAI